MPSCRCSWRTEAPFPALTARAARGPDKRLAKALFGRRPRCRGAPGSPCVSPRMPTWRPVRRPRPIPPENRLRSRENWLRFAGRIVESPGKIGFVSQFFFSRRPSSPTGRERPQGPRLPPAGRPLAPRPDGPAPARDASSLGEEPRCIALARWLVSAAARQSAGQSFILADPSDERHHDRISILYWSRPCSTSRFRSRRVGPILKQAPK
jgi:hypothetical protein